MEGSQIRIMADAYKPIAEVLAKTATTITVKA